MARLHYLVGASALALCGAASAQVTPAPADTAPAPQSQPQPQSQPPTPTPAPEPAPAPTATPRVAADAPTVTPSATPEPASRAARSRRRTDYRSSYRANYRPTPRSAHRVVHRTHVVTRTRTAAPRPTPTASPTPAPPPIETVVLPQSRTQPHTPPPWWPWPAGGAALLLGLALLLRRRAEPPLLEHVAESGLEPESDLTPLPEAPPALPVERPRVTIAVRPTRAGLNLLTATVESEVTLLNTGDAPAHNVRAAVGLMSAHAGADTDLADYAAQPILRPATPPFTLAPGEERSFRAVAAVPHDAIRSITAAGRPMFVPLVAVTVRYADAGAAGERQVAQAFAVGVERTDSAKLAPLWLDVPPRSYDNVAARAHSAALERN